MTGTATRPTKIQVLPGQLQFLRSNQREVLYSGAFGRVRSRAVCVKLAMRAAQKGMREGLCRKHLVTLKATTLKTLLEPDGDLPPASSRACGSGRRDLSTTRSTRLCS